MLSVTVRSETLRGVTDTYQISGLFLSALSLVLVLQLVLIRVVLSVALRLEILKCDSDMYLIS